jgi:outer membrane protein assembly factor BamB/tetratricopeptide (TPR) repeat protein
MRFMQFHGGIRAVAHRRDRSDFDRAAGGSLVENALHRFAIALLALTLSAGLPASSGAQVLLPEEVKSHLDEKPEKKSPFTLIAAKVEALEALDDFRAAVRKGTWDKAFKQIEKLLAEPPVGLVPARGGLLVPLRAAVAIDLAALPPTGQEAYRLFHDAEAKKLWEEAQKETGTAEMEKLSRLATLDLITSVGDLAANRLGDALFEQGDLLGAIDAWQRVLNYRPDSSLPRAVLLVKTGIAMADAGRWLEMGEVERELKERHPGETVTVGGAKVVAADHIAGLLAKHEAAPAGSAGDLPADLVLSDDVEPVWQFRISSKEQQKNKQVIRRWGMFGPEVIDLHDLPVATAVTETSLFGNWMGCDFALDLEGGKLRWRNGRFHEIAQKMRENNVVGAADRFSMVVDGNDVWAVVRPKGNQQQQQQQQMMQQQQGGAPGLHIVRLDPANGKELFRSGQVEELKQYNLLGPPLPAGGVVYLSAAKLNQPAELHVLALQSETGRLQWSTHVGTYQFQQQGMSRSIRPTMLLVGQRLYVDAHAGGMVELEATTGALRWAYNYPSQAPVQRQFNWFDDDNDAESAFPPSGPFAAGGLLFVKGMLSTRLIALRSDGSAFSWKRAVPENAMVAGIDDHRVYMASDELLAFDLKTQKLLWANNLPVKSGSIVPLVTQNRYYQFTPRGIYELDKATGNVIRLFRGADRDSGGGAIVITSKLLITVSGRAITAYPLKPTAETPPPAATADASGTTPKQ